MGDGSLPSEYIKEKPKIAVLGLGYVGLPTALGLAELGWDVTGADEDAGKVALLKSGKAPFYEPGLQELLTKHSSSRTFNVTEDVDGAVRSSTVLFVCVGTPQRENGAADLTQIEGIARTIARNLNSYKLIVEKSTVPAITAQWIKKTIDRYARASSDPSARNGARPQAKSGRGPAKSKISFDVASNPEFLKEGTAVDNFFHPDRVVIGVDSERAREILESIYRPLNCKVLVTEPSTAELIKHAANAYLATKISFINMVSDLCEAVGADITKVAAGLGLDPRIGPSFLSAGIGFGGYCLPKDLRAFIHFAGEHGVNGSLLEEVERINHGRIELLVKKIRQTLWVLEGKTIGILGLSFKPATDDIREAPSLKVIKALLKEGAILQLFDPRAMPNTQRLFPEVPGRLTYSASAYEAARGAHAVLLVTEWEEFRQLELPRLRDLMHVPVMVDGRNFFDPEEMRHLGFEYLSIGRDSVGKDLVPFSDATPVSEPVRK